MEWRKSANPRCRDSQAPNLRGEIRILILIEPSLNRLGCRERRLALEAVYNVKLKGKGLDFIQSLLETKRNPPAGLQNRA